MPYFYKVGIHGYEDHAEISLISEKKYTKRQFEKLFLSVLKKSFERLKKDMRQEKWFAERLKYFSFRALRYIDLYETILNILQEEYKFTPLKYTQNLSLWEYLPDTYAHNPPEGFEAEVVNLLNNLNDKLVKEMREIECQSGQ
jgi:hypothetical protein